MSDGALQAELSMRMAVAFARQAAKLRGTALCSASRDVLSVTGVGIAVYTTASSEHLCASNATVEALEDMQFVTGEGPSRDAFRSGQVVEIPTLDGGAGERWPSFVELAGKKDIGAVFAYPLVVHRVNVGVLSIYQHAEGHLSVAQRGDSFALGSVLAETILSMHPAPHDDAAPDIGDVVAYRAELYQASGMVAVQLRVSASEALLRIRAHAFALGHTVGEVAAEIVARRLRLPDDRPDLVGGS